jgi:hypothetical protein
MAAIDSAGGVEAFEQLAALATEGKHLGDCSRDFRLLVPVRR